MQTPSNIGPRAILTDPTDHGYLPTGRCSDRLRQNWPRIWIAIQLVHEAHPSSGCAARDVKIGPMHITERAAYVIRSVIWATISNRRCETLGHFSAAKMGLTRSSSTSQPNSSDSGETDPVSRRPFVSADGHAFLVNVSSCAGTAAASSIHRGRHGPSGSS
jgi:hypothetical protein